MSGCFSTLTYILKILLYSAENQATHDSTSSVNGAPLQDVEVFSFYYLGLLKL